MSDELKRDYQEKLGDKFGAIVNGVSYDWANGLVRLNEYRALFGDPANIEFINTFSGPFMSDVQQFFWRDLLLHITRLTDPVKSGGKQNITVWRLPDFRDDLELRAQFPDVCDDQELLARVESFADTATNPNRKIFEARKRETAALGAGEKLVLGHPLAATIGDSARCMQNLEKVLFTGPKTSDTVTFICD